MTRKLDQIERDLVQKVKRGEIGRRDLFRVSAAGATALAMGGGSLAVSTGAARADTGGPNYKDMGRVMPIGGANATGRWFDYSTLITPIEQFYVRNHYPTPRAADYPELDPANWKVRVHGAAVANPIELSY